MKPETWKTLALIFIILFTIETLTFIFLYRTGAEEIRKENECIFECTDRKAYEYHINNDLS